MKTQSKILLSVLSSVAVSIVIAFIAFSILRGVNTELKRSQTFGDIIRKTNALQVLTGSFKEGSGRSDIRQVKEILLSLDGLLKKISPRAVHEQVLIKQLQNSHQELGPLIDQLFVSGEIAGGIERERRNILSAQILMKVRFISDDTDRLMDISESRIISAQDRAGAMVIALIIILALTNGAIYFLSGRGIVRAQEALRSSEERFRVTLSSIGDAVIATDGSGRVTFINPVAVGLTGWPYEEATRQSIHTIFQIINEKTRQPAKNVVERVLRDGQVVNLANHTALLTRDGHEIPIEDSAAPIKDSTGNLSGVVLVFHDVTEKRRVQEALQESEKHFRALVEASSDVLYRMSPDWSEMRRLRSGHFLADTESSRTWLQEYIHPDDQAHVTTIINKAIRNKSIFELEHRVLRVDGTIGWTFSRAIPLLDANGEVVEWFGAASDITQRKKAEEELRQSEQLYKTLHAELELRVRERTAELERKNQELQEFAFVASHDLAEPLRKIQAFGSLLEARSADRLGDLDKNYISRMTGAANRMQELLEALLRYSRIETQGRDLVPVKLEEIVQTVTSDLEVSINKIGAHVEVGPLPLIHGDPYQWRQLFQNLIANAVKYHRSEVKTVIKVYGEENDGTCCIFVEDNGIGFDERYLDKIFQPFQRLHGKNEYPGTGIGLAICKKIVERHKGTITAKSTPGRGSTFMVTLPVKRGE